MNYESNKILFFVLRFSLFAMLIIIFGCCSSVELTERDIVEETHNVPGDTIKIIEYIDTSGNATNYFEQLYFAPNPDCDTAAIIEKYANLNLELKRKNANLWVKFNGFKRKFELEVQTKPKIIIEKDTILTTKYIEKKSFIDDIKWFIIIGFMVLIIGYFIKLKVKG